ncbi:TPA: hypothetical protein SML50_001442 [Serratia fonticola]|nr:hypothetical protein [Serratia fonticola]
MSRLEADSRTVTHHQVKIDTLFRTQKLQDSDRQNCICPIPQMEFLAQKLLELKGHNHSYRSGDLVIGLQDIELYSKNEDGVPTHLCLLVNAVDKNGSITVVRNTRNKHRFEVSPKRLEGEGYEISSHIVINLQGKSRTHDLFMTSIPKVATNIISLYLNRLLFEIARTYETDFECNTVTNIVDPSTGKDKKIYFKPVFYIDGKIDTELFDKLNKEGLSDVVLIRNEHKVIRAADMHDAIIPIESTLRIKPGNKDGGITSWLKSVCNHFKSDNGGKYEIIRIKFKEEDSANPRTVSMRTDNLKLDALEKTFIKKSLITGFRTTLKDSYDIIDTEIRNKILEL